MVKFDWLMKRPGVEFEDTTVTNISIIQNIISKQKLHFEKTCFTILKIISHRIFENDSPEYE